MHKLLLYIFLVAIALLFSSEIFAQSACPPGHTGSLQKSGVAKGADCGTDSCFVTSRTSGFDCYSKTAAPAAAPGAAGAGTGTPTGPTTPSIDCSKEPAKCTGGRGLRCDLKNDGKPIPSDDRTGPDIGIYTAIGCVPTEPKALVEGLLKYGILASGAIAFLIMILAALQMITAEGNPEAIKGGQEKFYSAIIGLLLIIFAVLLMQVIGVDILGLPGFSNSVFVRP